MKQKKENGVMMQYFEWYLPSSCDLWNQLKKDAPKLAEKGISALWLPPAYKGRKGRNEVGYAVYDLYDLGEFDQRGSVATKYGTKEEYLAAVDACHQAGIEVYADIVLNHRLSGDEIEIVSASEYDQRDRTKRIAGQKNIKVNSRFTFPGRNGTYSDFIWDHTCFNGTDTDLFNLRQSVYLFSGEKWNEYVDDELGNFDYLLGLNVNFENQVVTEHLTDWGRWYTDTVHPDGYRLDGIKHIDRRFFPKWLKEMRSHTGRNLFAVGEYCTCYVSKLQKYIEQTDGCMALFDFPLHFAFYNASRAKGTYDLSEIFNETLTTLNPDHSVTFVDNHDTQPGQALESTVEPWFVPIAYAFILLQPKGFPCVFYKDYYGSEIIGSIIDRMLEIRREKMYGTYHHYFDCADLVGWTMEGDETHPQSGLAVLVSTETGGIKKMYAGRKHAGEEWCDMLNGKKTVIDSNGYGIFTCHGGSVSCYCCL